MPTVTQATTIANLKAFAEDFTERLSQMVTASDEAPALLEEAMRYSLLAPGKRLRPFLIHKCCELVGGDADAAFPAVAAMEMVHAFSLIHDDLPAMDDDDLRRGRPTCHKVYGEAIAILAGDALLALAFETLATHVADSARSVALAAELAGAAGWRGMIGGQTADLQGEQEPPSLERVRHIHAYKTGALFKSACRMGGIAGRADNNVVNKLGMYGHHMGLAFQIADDLLDITSSAIRLGKNVGKDATQKKQTYPACVGTEQSRSMAEDAVETAIMALCDFGAEADELRVLARLAVVRSM